MERIRFAVLSRASNEYSQSSRLYLVSVKLLLVKNANNTRVNSLSRHRESNSYRCGLHVLIAHTVSVADGLYIESFNKTPLERHASGSPASCEYHQAEFKWRKPVKDRGQLHPKSEGSRETHGLMVPMSSRYTFSGGCERHSSTTANLGTPWPDWHHPKSRHEPQRREKSAQHC